MDAQFFHSLTEGDFGNGVHLCQSLLEGDFWTRSQGCYSVYRGKDQIGSIDYGHILATRTGKGQLSLPTYVSHENDSDYYYSVRCASGSGKEEQGTMAMVRLSLDKGGKRRVNRPNKVRGLTAQAVSEGKVRLGWWYWPLGQEVAPDRFSIFGDNGSGTIDYNRPLGEVAYSGGHFYSYLSPAGEDQQTCRFSVRAVAAGGGDDGNLVYVAAVVDLSGPAGIKSLSSGVCL